MGKPDITINEEDFPSAIFNVEEIKSLTERAWGKLFAKSSVNIEASKIVISVGDHATNVKINDTTEEKIIDLELSAGDLDCNPDKLYSLIFHELYHIYDRFDPGFKLSAYNSDEKNGLTEKKIKEINSLWDVYIESRKYFFHGIKPVACFLHPEKSPKSAVIENNISAFDSCIDKNKAKKTIEKIWENKSKITWDVLFDMTETLSNNQIENK